MSFWCLSLFILSLLSVPPFLGRGLLRCELALNVLELILPFLVHLLLLLLLFLLQVIWMQLLTLIRLLLLFLCLRLRMIQTFVVCWRLSWPFRQLMVSFWWTCLMSFGLCERIWRVFDDHLSHLLLMMSDCPLAICHKKGEYILDRRFC